MPPLGPQPKGARGTVGHPYSALNLRLLLACFSLVTWTVLGILVLSTGHPGLAAVLGVFALVSVAVGLALLPELSIATRDAGVNGSST